MIVISSWYLPCRFFFLKDFGQVCGSLTISNNKQGALFIDLKKEKKLWVPKQEWNFFEQSIKNNFNSFEIKKKIHTHTTITNTVPLNQNYQKENI